MSDEEYVEQVRRRVSRPRRAAILAAVSGTLFLAIYALVFWLGWRLIQDMAGHEEGPWLGIAAGMGCGVSAGFILGFAVQAATFAVTRWNGTDQRTERLLVKYDEQCRLNRAACDMSSPKLDPKVKRAHRKFLGRQIFPTPKTDEVYVASLQESAARARWFAAFFVGLAMLEAGVFIAICVVWWSFANTPAPDELPCDPEQGMWCGFVVGTVWGVVGAAMLYLWAMSAGQVASGLRGYRTERLMLKYHDELPDGEDQNLAKVV